MLTETMIHLLGGNLISASPHRVEAPLMGLVGALRAAKGTLGSSGLTHGQIVGCRRFALTCQREVYFFKFRLRRDK